MWRQIVAGSLIIAIGIAMGYFISRLQERKDKIIATLSMLGSIALLILTAFFSPLPPDYVALNRPWLVVTPVVSHLKEEGFRLSYELKNIGKLPVKDPRIAFVSPVMRGFSKSILDPQDIAPGDSITYEPNAPLSFPTQRLPLYSHFTLAIDYHSQVGDTKHHFWSVFGFVLSKDDLREGRYPLVSIQYGEGEFSDQKLAELLGFWMQFER